MCILHCTDPATPIVFRAPTGLHVGSTLLAGGESEMGAFAEVGYSFRLRLPPHRPYVALL